jgi:hypothetical protein
VHVVYSHASKRVGKLLIEYFIETAISISISFGLTFPLACVLQLFYAVLHATFATFQRLNFQIFSHNLFAQYDVLLP